MIQLPFTILKDIISEISVIKCTRDSYTLADLQNKFNLKLLKQKRPNLFINNSIQLEINADDIVNLEEVTSFFRDRYDPNLIPVHELFLGVSSLHPHNVFQFLINQLLPSLIGLEVLKIRIYRDRDDTGNTGNNKVKVTLPKLIGKELIPDTVRDLSLLVDNGIDVGIEIGTIPNSVKQLMVSHRLVKHDIHRLIPSSVSILKVTQWTSYPEEIDLIPSTVTDFSIYSFDSRLDKPSIVLPPFPPTVQQLYLCGLPPSNNTQPINPNILPPCVKKLTFSAPTPLSKGSIPSSTEDIYFFRHRDEIQPGFLHDGIKTLQFDYFCSFFHRNSIPSTVTKLILRSQFSVTQGPSVFQDGDYSILPQGLLHLEISEKQVTDTTRLPPNLTHLDCVLPSSLLKLTVWVTNDGLPFIPRSVKQLQLEGRPESGSDQIKIPPGYLPHSIEKLILAGQFKINGPLPSNIKHLDYSGCHPVLFKLNFIDWKELGTVTNIEKLTLPFEVQNYDNETDGDYERFTFPQETLESYASLITDLISTPNRKSTQLTIEIRDYLKLLSIDPKNQYIYYHLENGYQDGFILKNNISNLFLSK
eukprot:gene5498-6850_t